MRRLLLIAVLGPIAAAQSDPEIRAAVTRALPLLQSSAASFVAQRACVSCHHNILPILTLHLARDRGFEIDTKTLSAVEEKTFRSLRGAAALDDAVQAATLNDPTPDESYLLIAANTAGIKPDLTNAVYARRLVRWQRDGHWVTSDFRPPHSSSLFTATATAVRAISLYMPEELRTERDACIRRARQWLVTTHPTSAEDATFRLLGLVWASAPANEIERVRHDLLALQKPEGGWPELPSYTTDAYSTGEALFALHEAGLPAGDTAWRKGVKSLISTQAADGTWRVHTRMLSPAEVSPKYFDTGFPYQRDEFLSYAGSCWAVMALLSALPEQMERPVPSVANAASAAADPAWARTALFGTPQQLQGLLDSGLDPNSLDPNSKDKNGTTLLMMAAPDAKKVQLLLAHGADAKARAASGCDALTIAAAYRGTVESLRALLDAGAGSGEPQNNRFRNMPLVFSSMTGDLENVKLLLTHGADPSAPSHGNAPLAEAVTFGYPDVVQALIAAGASANMTESSGINLIHWAVIANHPQVIPALVRAGVPLNAIDESGFTPLMYAATIDFGNVETIKTLLRAGADPKIRNHDGRDAHEQAHHFQHVSLEAALR